MILKAFLFLFLVFPLHPAWSRQSEPVKIGMLIPDKSSVAAKEGAELAIKMANDKQKAHGYRFQLITKDLSGPWGTGSKQAVDLIFEDKVWALIGSHDGRNAHLVEQAATKAPVVFLSAWSSDPTLSQAFVPWFFNCVPNDFQQAGRLISEIYEKRKITRVAVISDKSYDSNQALKTFLKSAELSGKNKPVDFLFDNYTAKPDSLMDQLSKAKAGCIVLFCQPSVSLKIIHLLRKRKMSQPVFGSLSILNENLLSEKELTEFDNILHVSCGVWNESANLHFRQEYRNAYGKMPGMVAAYAFDGMNLLIEAIRISKSRDLDKIKQALSQIHYEGVTGPIRFDAKGNRNGNFAVMKILNGLPESVSAD
jgi:branched-chain amino acid transport system substrate-binding protein